MSPGQRRDGVQAAPGARAQLAAQGAGVVLVQAFGSVYCTWMRKPLPPGVVCSVTSRGPGRLGRPAPAARSCSRRSRTAGRRSGLPGVVRRQQQVVADGDAGQRVGAVRGPPWARRRPAPRRRRRSRRRAWRGRSCRRTRRPRGARQRDRRRSATRPALCPVPARLAIVVGRLARPPGDDRVGGPGRRRVAVDEAAGRRARQGRCRSCCCCALAVGRLRGRPEGAPVAGSSCCTYMPVAAASRWNTTRSRDGPRCRAPASAGSRSSRRSESAGSDRRAGA